MADSDRPERLKSADEGWLEGKVILPHLAEMRRARDERETDQERATRLHRERRK